MPSWLSDILNYLAALFFAGVSLGVAVFIARKVRGKKYLVPILYSIFVIAYFPAAIAVAPSGTLEVNLVNAIALFIGCVAAASSTFAFAFLVFSPGHRKIGLAIGSSGFVGLLLSLLVSYLKTGRMP